MAVRGQRPKATVLRLVQGNVGKRPVPANDPMPAGRPNKPKSLKGAASRLWDEFIVPAFWLSWADGPKAAMWCRLQAEYDRANGAIVAARIGQLRALGSELGFDPASRARLGAGGDLQKPKDPAAKYFD